MQVSFCARGAWKICISAENVCHACEMLGKFYSARKVSGKICFCVQGVMEDLVWVQLIREDLVCVQVVGEDLACVQSLREDLLCVQGVRKDLVFV